jgi:hypothetical protein
MNGKTRRFHKRFSSIKEYMGIEPSYNTHTTLALFSCDIIAKVMSMMEIPNLNNLVENDEELST